jgi:uncharacterized protein YecE (DUF72 family)
MKLANKRLKVGCCGFRAARADYMQMFPVVEVQQTFYQPPQISTLKKWREDAPKDFEFTIKAWQLITHEARSPTYKRLKRELTETEREECGAFRLTPIVKEAWAMTAACAAALKATRILFQCPASFTPTDGNVRNMRRFFSTIERAKNQSFFWEPRGGWPPELILKLCRELELTHVVDPFAARTVTPERVYYRLHGRNGWRYVYENEELEELLEMLPPQDSTAKNSASYIFFNNVRMSEDAARFQQLAEDKN